MDPYAPKQELLKDMHYYRTKQSSGDEDEPQDVQAGQWWRLGDMPDVGLIGDGGEARAVKVNEDDEVVFRVIPGDWVVETSSEIFEKFTNEEFNEHFMSVIHSKLSLKMNTNKTQESKDGEHAITRETPYQKAYKEKHEIKTEKPS